MSLLEFLIHCIRKHDPTLLKFTTDLVPCEVAAKIELTILSNKLGDFERGLAKIKKEILKAQDQLNVLIELPDTPELQAKLLQYEKFLTVFQSFALDTALKYADSTAAVLSLQKEIAELIVLFGEDESTKSTDFFELFFTFARDFSNCYKNLLLSEKVKQEQEARKRA